MPKVLVVDDETEIRQMLLKYLKREGICGIECENGTEALAYLKENAVDLVILDIMMAGMDGIEVLKQIRQRMGEIPVILLSARQEEYDKVLGLGLGADDYVTKPFSPGEMMARVKVQLRKGMKIEKKGRTDTGSRRTSHGYRELPGDSRWQRGRACRQGILVVKIFYGTSGTGIYQGTDLSSCVGGWLRGR